MLKFCYTKRIHLVLLPIFTAGCYENQRQRETYQHKQEEPQKIIHVLKTLEQRREQQRQAEEEKLKEEQCQKEMEKETYNHTFRHEQREMQDLAIKSVQLMFALDFTSSSYGLHNDADNPYSEVIEVMGEVMKPIPGAQNFIAWGFGRGEHRDLMPICRSGECPSYGDFQKKYKLNIQNADGGNSCACSSVDEAVRIFQSQEPQHTVLFVITDGRLASHTNLSEIRKLPIALYFIVVDECDKSEIEKMTQSEDFIGMIDYHEVRSRPVQLFRYSNAKIVAADYVQFMKEKFPIMQKKMNQINRRKNKWSFWNVNVG